MAGPIRCDLCQELEAVFLISNTQTGDTTAACVADFARLGLESAKAVLPPAEILAALGIATEAPAEADGRAKGGRKGRKSQASAGPDPDPEPETSEGVAEAPAAAADAGDSGL